MNATGFHETDNCVLPCRICTSIVNELAFSQLLPKYIRVSAFAVLSVAEKHIDVHIK